MSVQVQKGIRSLPYELRSWPATASEARLHIVMVPGNPGLTGYYVRFLSELAKLVPHADIHCVGHLGQAPTAASVRGPEPANLDEQVEHKLAYVDSLDAKDKPIVMIGHSVGGYISSQIVKKRPDRVASVHMLFPTISDMLKAPNGNTLSRAASPVVSKALLGASGLFSIVPKVVLRPVVASLYKQEGPSVQVTASLVSSPGAVKSVLTMARHEMVQITDVDKDVLREFGGRMRWYWAEGATDHWVLPSSIEEIEATLDKAGHPKSRRIRCQEGMQHAFVLNMKHCDALAAKCAAWIKEDVAAAN